MEMEIFHSFLFIKTLQSKPFFCLGTLGYFCEQWRPHIFLKSKEEKDALMVP
jgi:hypothetical protein